MKYNGIIISDIHFGAVNSEQIKHELNNIFLDYLNGMKKIDFIVITGDYFDHKLYVNDKTSELALSFMDKLVEISRDNGCPIRIIYGTESHEVNQYNLFSIYENDKHIDFKVIYTVQEEELLQNMNVLYLPEEFVFDKKEYYDKYFKNENTYDYIFGHGIIQEVMTEACRNMKKSKEKTRKKVPVFTTVELDKICGGQVFFGHYHINTNISDKIFYVGSFSRWKHGESEDKGFYHVTYDTNKKTYDQKFIENCLAKKYKTYTYSYDNKIINSETELVNGLKKLDKIVKNDDCDYAKFVFNIPENHPNPEFVINILNERYKYNDNIKIQITNGYVEKKRKINKEKLNNLMIEYPIIFDKNAKLEDKLVYFIKKRWDKDISIDSTKKYLYGNENEIDD